jgi:hypothetical protein
MKTKIHLSEEEWNLAINADILLTKNRVLEKLFAFLGEIATVSKTIFQAESIMLPVSIPWKTPRFPGGELPGTSLPGT